MSAVKSTLSNRSGQSKTKQSAAEREMEFYGITRVPVDYFHLGEFRYTSLNEALAQAKKAHG